MTDPRAIGGRNPGFNGEWRADRYLPEDGTRACAEEDHDLVGIFADVLGSCGSEPRVLEAAAFVYCVMLTVLRVRA